MSVLPATTAPPAAAGAEHHAAATCASFGTPAEHAQTGALNLTLPIPYGRHATIERRFSPTRFIRRHAAVVPALGLASAADKRYSLGVTERPNALLTARLRRSTWSEAGVAVSDKLSLEVQSDDIAEAVRARYTMVASILRAMLYSSHGPTVKALGGPAAITLEQLARIYQEGSGEYGICFEYALHDSIRARHKSIYPVIEEVLHDHCRIRGAAESILFGLEKNGRLNIVETAKNSLTDEARVLVGKAGKPPYLKHRIGILERAFRTVRHRERLPHSIRGSWQADLFVGSPTAEQWIGTTLKVNKEALRAAPGLRLGVFPSSIKEGPKKDKEKNLILCPLPYRGDFMVLFSASFQIAKQLMYSKGDMPKAPALIYEDDLTVAEWLSARKGYPVMGILEALHPLMQPGLLITKKSDDSLSDTGIYTFAPIPIVD